ncbi:L domain-like protein [Microstroma glucosiphilum]|uniref:L domain-like protein n=1 Tax=Pseudomicrostroma glucosiphilum TaxID=1684307 RepID=A0A316U9M4_9BASI|nr:L domain-like protein [Pseudomicrostroma glucosiphilum]PWN21538.1 L domain-like protein [Pseudomicrostroma glucosiphilum]
MAEPQTVTGDAYVLSLARFIRSHETALSGSVPASTAGPSWLPTLGPAKTKAAGPSRIIPPKPLSISLHHLSYILLRFEALNLPIGRLDEPLPSALRDRRPQSTFSFISASEQRNIANRANRGGALDPETMSLGSVRSALTRMSIGAASTASWFGGSGSAARPPDPDREVKYLYSAFTKLPAVNVIQPEASGLVEGFEDAATPTTLTPFDVFKNLHLLSFTDVDPRTITGWERLSCQLKSLTLIRTGIEDVEELIVGQVLAELIDQDKEQPGAANGHGLGKASASSSSHAENDQGDEPSATLQKLPSLSWHFLSSLCLPSSSLTFFPSLPLPSLRSLDLSHNLLNSIPPSLANSPHLASLDLTGNLIEDCRGAREALPSIRTLNLRSNRLEALSGLDSLYTLKQIDLRANAVYEASEVGRLAQLPALEKIWIKDNPLMDEYLDHRVEVLVEFAKEGWPMEGQGTIILDGEAPGYWEKGRVSEKLPLGMKLAPPGTRRRRRTASLSGQHSISSGSRGSRGSTPRAEENVVPWAPTHEGGAQVLSVKHKGQHGGASSQKNVAVGEPVRKGKYESGHSTSSELDGAGLKAEESASREPSPSANPRGSGRHASEKKRHRRVVNLDDDGSSSSNGKASAATKVPEELSEAEKLKREVLFGSHDRSVAAGKGSSGLYASRATSGTAKAGKAATPSSSRTASPHSLPDISNAALRADKAAYADEPSKETSRALNSADGATEDSSAPLQAVTRSRARPSKAKAKGKASSAAIDDEAHGEGASQDDRRKSQVQTAADLRARIEGLKKEVGEDWMRVLSRGEG